MNNATSIIENEIDEYLTGTVEISEGVEFSQYKLIKRIFLFENKIYPQGKIDKQGKYKYWFDIISPRVNSEIKNLRIDTKNFIVFSENPVKDFSAVYIANARIKEWLWSTGKAEDINENTEQYSAMGNLLMKKVKDGYETTDPINTYIINQSAKTIDDTAVIERHQLTQSELRAKAGVWENVEEVIKTCGDRTFSATEKSTEKETTNPFYEIYERNGEISESALFEAQGKKGGKEDKYVMAKIIVAGLKKGDSSSNFVLFAEDLGKKKMSDLYIEAHRGIYKGRWWREGLYEMLFDHQIRANEIGNQLSRGLEWASKVVFKASDNTIVNNILTEIGNGDIIKSADLSQVDVRMLGLDQLIADWNRLMDDANQIANSYEVIQGQSMPSGTPFALGSLLDSNATKLFILLRQKLGIAYEVMFKKWILPELIKDLKGEDIIRITGDTQFLDDFRKLAVNNWYAKNLVKIGPHTPEMAIAIKENRLNQLKAIDPIIKNVKEIWEGVLPRLWVTVTGENIEFEENLQTINGLLQFEEDPQRRAFLLDMIYAKKGIPLPPPAAPIQPQQTNEPQQ